MNSSVKLALAAALAAAALAPLSPASAQVAWTNWTAETNGDTTGAATGTLTLPGQSPITVSYTGDIKFAQVNGGGTNPWTLPDGTLPDPAYLSTNVPNGPPDSDIIALTGGPGTGVGVDGINTLTFSAPVVNPLLAITSLGSTAVTSGVGHPIVVDYDFSAPFTLLSQGSDRFGDGTLTQPTPTTLEGQEGSGTIQFDGTFSSISWAAPQFEYWHGFTVGSAPVPEASTTASFGLLLMLGMGGVIVAKKRKTA